MSKLEPIEWEYALAHERPSQPMNDRGDLLRRYGKEGWELVAISNSTLYFKRPKR